MLSSLNPSERAAVDAIIAGKVGWAWTLALEAAGHTETVLAALEAGGWLVRWPLAVGVAWTFTPIGARWAEVELYEARDGQWPAWVDSPAPVRKLHAAKHAHEVQLLWPELVVDPLPGPEFLVDEVSGEVLRLFAGATGTGGVPVRIDPRLARRIPRRRGRPRRVG